MLIDLLRGQLRQFDLSPRGILQTSFEALHLVNLLVRLLQNRLLWLHMVSSVGSCTGVRPN